MRIGGWRCNRCPKEGDGSPVIAKLYCLSAVAVLVAAGTLQADVCRTGHVQTYQANTAYVAPAYIAPVALAVPLYGASYSGGDPETAELLRALLAEIQALRSDVSSLRTGPQAQAAPGRDPVAVLSASCAACHTAGPKLKGEFEMFAPDGKPLKLNGPDRRAIEKRVREGTMPPPDKGKLSADDKAAIAAFAASPPAPAAAPPAKLPAGKK
jgi:mono/diheme cytochrome c family protein